MSLLTGLLPVHRSELPGNVLAGVTLAALGIPEVLGYATIAHMPAVTGLYNVYETHASYPVLRYFHYRYVYYALPRVLLIALDAHALLCTSLSPRYRDLVDSPATRRHTVRPCGCFASWCRRRRRNRRRQGTSRYGESGTEPRSPCCADA